MRKEQGKFWRKVEVVHTGTMTKYEVLNFDLRADWGFVSGDSRKADIWC